MTDDLAPFRERHLAQMVDELRELLSRSNIAFLMGAGCSKCAGLPLMPELTTRVLGSQSLGAEGGSLLGSVVAEYGNNSNANIEDFLSDLVDLLAIAERRGAHGRPGATVRVGKTACQADAMRRVIEGIKREIAGAIACGSSSTAVDCHRRFIHAIHRTLQSGKAACPAPVDYFLLNYDTLIEDALGLEHVPYTDGFSGGATGWWNISNYHASGLCARVFKIHGSIDWRSIDGDVLPQRLRPALGVDGHSILIWPATTKYRETQNDPFAQILEVMRQRLRPGANGELVLVTCGYSFNDAHINIELRRALEESDERLTLVVFTGADAPDGQVAAWLQDPAIQKQVRVHANRGLFHGGAEPLKSTQPLPWWKFEVLARLLGGER